MIPTLSLPIRVEASILDGVASLREQAISNEDSRKQSALGQFFTPASIGKFMAGFFSEMPDEVSVLDPGAGIGLLSAAFVENVLAITPMSDQSSSQLGNWMDHLSRIWNKH